MEHHQVVSSRRMVRRYTGEAVPPDVIERVVDAIRSGPTAGNTQGVTVVVVTRDETRSAIAHLGGEPDYTKRGFDPWLSSAPVHLVLCVEPGRYDRRYAEPDKDSSSLMIPSS